MERPSADGGTSDAAGSASSSNLGARMALTVHILDGTGFNRPGFLSTVFSRNDQHAVQIQVQHGSRMPIHCTKPWTDVARHPLWDESFVFTPTEKSLRDDLHLVLLVGKKQFCSSVIRLDESVRIQLLTSATPVDFSVAFRTEVAVLGTIHVTLQLRGGPPGLDILLTVVEAVNVPHRNPIAVIKMSEMPSYDLGPPVRTSAEGAVQWRKSATVRVSNPKLQHLVVAMCDSKDEIICAAPIDVETISEELGEAWYPLYNLSASKQWTIAQDGTASVRVQHRLVFPSKSVIVSVTGLRLKGSDYQYRSSDRPCFAITVGEETYAFTEEDRAAAHPRKRTHEFPIQHSETDLIEVEVWDPEMLGEEVEGHCQVRLSELFCDEAWYFWLPLSIPNSPSTKAEAQVRVTTVNCGVRGERARDRRVVVTLVGASGLKSQTVIGECNPICQLHFGSIKKRSKLLKKTSDPKWEEEFTFSVQSDALSQTLSFEILDKSLMGEDYIGMTRPFSLSESIMGEIYPLTLDLLTIDRKTNAEKQVGRIRAAYQCLNCGLLEAKPGTAKSEIKPFCGVTLLVKKVKGLSHLNEGRPPRECFVLASLNGGSPAQRKQTQSVRVNAKRDECVWDEEFQFEVDGSNPTRYPVEVELWNAAAASSEQASGAIGSCLVPLNNFVRGTPEEMHVTLVAKHSGEWRSSTEFEETQLDVVVTMVNCGATSRPPTGPILAISLLKLQGPLADRSLYYPTASTLKLSFDGETLTPIRSAIAAAGGKVGADSDDGNEGVEAVTDDEYLLTGEMLAASCEDGLVAEIWRGNEELGSCAVPLKKLVMNETIEQWIDMYPMTAFSPTTASAKTLVLLRLTARNFGRQPTLRISVGQLTGPIFAKLTQESEANDGTVTTAQLAQASPRTSEQMFMRCRFTVLKGDEVLVGVVATETAALELPTQAVGMAHGLVWEDILTIRLRDASLMEYTLLCEVLTDVLSDREATDQVPVLSERYTLSALQENMEKEVMLQMVGPGEMGSSCSESIVASNMQQLLSGGGPRGETQSMGLRIRLMKMTGVPIGSVIYVRMKTDSSVRKSAIRHIDHVGTIILNEAHAFFIADGETIEISVHCLHPPHHGSSQVPPSREDSVVSDQDRSLMSAPVLSDEDEDDQDAFGPASTKWEDYVVGKADVKLSSIPDEKASKKNVDVELRFDDKSRSNGSLAVRLVTANLVSSKTGASGDALQRTLTDHSLTNPVSLSGGAGGMSSSSRTLTSTSAPRSEGTLEIQRVIIEGLQHLSSAEKDGMSCVARFVLEKKEFHTESISLASSPSSTSASMVMASSPVMNVSVIEWASATLEIILLKTSSTSSPKTPEVGQPGVSNAIVIGRTSIRLSGMPEGDMQRFVRVRIPDLTPRTGTSSSSTSTQPPRSFLMTFKMLSMRKNTRGQSRRLANAPLDPNHDQLRFVIQPIDCGALPQQKLRITLHELVTCPAFCTSPFLSLRTGAQIHKTKAAQPNGRWGNTFIFEIDSTPFASSLSTSCIEPSPRHNISPRTLQQQQQDTLDTQADSGGPTLDFSLFGTNPKNKTTRKMAFCRFLVSSLQARGSCWDGYVELFPVGEGGQQMSVSDRFLIFVSIVVCQTVAEEMALPNSLHNRTTDPHLLLDVSELHVDDSFGGLTLASGGTMAPNPTSSGSASPLLSAQPPSLATSAPPPLPTPIWLSCEMDGVVSASQQFMSDPVFRKRTASSYLWQKLQPLTFWLDDPNTQQIVIRVLSSTNANAPTLLQTTFGPVSSILPHVVTLLSLPLLPAPSLRKLSSRILPTSGSTSSFSGAVVVSPMASATASPTTPASARFPGSQSQFASSWVGALKFSIKMAALRILPSGGGPSENADASLQLVPSSHSQVGFEDNRPTLLISISEAERLPL